MTNPDQAQDVQQRDRATRLRTQVKSPTVGFIIVGRRFLCQSCEPDQAKGLTPSNHRSSLRLCYRRVLASVSSFLSAWYGLIGFPLGCTYLLSFSATYNLHPYFPFQCELISGRRTCPTFFCPQSSLLPFLSSCRDTNNWTGAK